MGKDRKTDVSMPRRLFDAIGAVNNAVSQRDQNVSRIEQDYPGEKLRADAYSARKERLAAVNSEFDEEWVSALQNLDELCKKVRQRQPHLNDLTPEHINAGSLFPDALAFGRMHITYQNWDGYVPRMIPFPFKKSLWLPDLDTKHRMIHQLLLRLMQCMPVGNVEITAADPLRLGTSLDPFLTMLNVKQLFPDRRMLTRSDELEYALSRLTDYVEDLLQNKFTGEIKSWSSYNSANYPNPLPYKLLLIFGVPQQLTDKSLWYLGRLLEHGPVCGVLPIITINEEYIEERKYAGLSTAIHRFCQRIDSIVPAEIMKKHLSEMKAIEEHEFWPRQSQLKTFLTAVGSKYDQSTKFNKNLIELWSGDPPWGRNSTQNLHAPIGWNSDHNVVHFTIGGVNTEHHTLLAGKTGSGKSNLLHVLIQSACHYYSPSELNIYLLDYKEGVEFNVYAKECLPQIKLVATESDPEYGLTVLTHLVEEIERRAKAFKKLSLRDFYEYRTTTGIDIPRILLIIDEFQILFSEDANVARAAEALFSKLLKQGRSHGIHLLLATQTIRGLQALSLGGLTSQLTCKIALSCSQEDSAFVLGQNNWEAADLNSPPEGILNNANGAKSANQRFLCPLADRVQCQEHSQNLTHLAHQKGYSGTLKVFNGSKLPRIPKSPWFTSRRSEAIQLHLGEQLSFEAEPLSLTLDNRPSNNLLISGYNDSIHDGLLASVILSLDSHAGIDEIIYLNGRSFGLMGTSKYLNKSSNIAVVKHDSVATMNLPNIPGELQKLKRILIIDGMDSIKEFHSGPAIFRPMKKDEPASSQESMKQILELGPQNGTFVIAFADNWKRCNASCKDFLGYFEMRVGFCMNDDDAGSFVTGVIGKFKGLEKDTRAIFADRLKNHVSWFRPYTIGESS